MRELSPEVKFVAEILIVLVLPLESSGWSNTRIYLPFSAILAITKFHDLGLEENTSENQLLLGKFVTSKDKS